MLSYLVSFLSRRTCLPHCSTIHQGLPILLKLPHTVQPGYQVYPFTTLILGMQILPHSLPALPSCSYLVVRMYLPHLRLLICPVLMSFDSLIISAILMSFDILLYLCYYLPSNLPSNLPFKVNLQVALLKFPI